MKTFLKLVSTVTHDELEHCAYKKQQRPIFDFRSGREPVEELIFKTNSFFTAVQTFELLELISIFDKHRSKPYEGVKKN